MEGREIPSKSLRTFTLSPRRIRRSTPTADTGRRGDACHGPGTRKKRPRPRCAPTRWTGPILPTGAPRTDSFPLQPRANRDHTGEFPASA
jgi:hypothetical protein